MNSTRLRSASYLSERALSLFKTIDHILSLPRESPLYMAENEKGGESSDEDMPTSARPSRLAYKPRPARLGDDPELLRTMHQDLLDDYTNIFEFRNDVTRSYVHLSGIRSKFAGNIMCDSNSGNSYDVLGKSPLGK